MTIDDSDADGGVREQHRDSTVPKSLRRRFSEVIDRSALEGSSGIEEVILEAERVQPNILMVVKPGNRAKIEGLLEGYTYSKATDLIDGSEMASTTDYDLIITDDISIARKGTYIIVPFNLDEVSLKQVRSQLNEALANYQPPEPEPEKLRILILDDEGICSAMMSLYQQELEDLGYEVILTDNEEDAMCAIKETGVHLAIFDYNYHPYDPEGKEKNGFTLSARIRPDYPNLAVIVNTGREDLIPELERTAFQHGVDAVVLKSANLTPLIEAVKKAMYAYHGTIEVDAEEILQATPEKAQKE